MRRPLAIIAIAVAASAGLLSAVPARVAADDATGVTQTAATVVRLDPANGRLRVSITIRVTNHTPDGVEQYSCTKYTGGFFSLPYPGSCERAVRYYVDQTSAVVDNAAEALTAVSGGHALTTVPGDAGDAFRPVTIQFPRLFNGKRRTMVVSYTVRGGEPRSDAPVRTLRAFARFCVPANGSTSGTVTVRVPKRFSMTTSGAKLTAGTSGGDRVFSSGTIRSTAGWQACFSGTNAGAYRTERLAGPGGSTIRLRSWPEDPTWADGVRDDVTSSLPMLERLTGVAPTASGPIDIREAGSASQASGSFDAGTNTITLGEDFGEPALVQHELAHAWFNRSTFADTWLAEGFAEWAGRSVAGETPCAAPDDSAGSIDIAHWATVAPGSSATDHDAAVAQYLAACHVITAVADAAGEERMTTAIIALLARRDPYAVDGAGAGTRASKVATWQDWLDAVDELALDPAGAPEGLAAGLLVQYKVAPDPDLLARRAEARRAYRALLAASPEWAVPVAVRAPLADWKFDAASAAISAASGTWQVTGETDTTLAGVDARHGVAAEAWQKATSVSELRAAADLANRQLTAARDVAAARTALDQPLDLVQRIGMFATIVPGADDAIVAVREGDDDAAAKAAAQIRGSVAGLRATGEQRIVVGSTAALIVLAALAFVVTRRAIRLRALRIEARRSAAVVAVATAHPGRAPGTEIASEAPRGDRWNAQPLDDSPTQRWDGPPLLVVQSSEGDPEIGRLVRPRPPRQEPPSALPREP